ncbi:MAG: AmmeMemoRadiSam system radical SAM enzyme [Candidatus Omnitrophota bacterium]
MTFEELLAEHTREGELVRPMPDGRLECFACSHRCRLAEGKSGICKVRFVKNGKLRVPWGYVSGVQDDPVEKKPFYHALPGARAMSFGMLGCDFHCDYCQNWVTSQTLRNGEAVQYPNPIRPEDLVALAVRERCEIVTSTYNEPLITSEWAAGIFREARRRGLYTAYVSNGNGTPEVWGYLKPWLDLVKVDLKCFQEAHYRSLGGSLQVICENIRLLYRQGFWLETLTLLIPGFNDSEEELVRLTEFVASVSPDIPWHVTAFHKDYRMTTARNTKAEDLLRAAEIGKRSGLRYVYAGNLPGAVSGLENTYCHACGGLVIEREGFTVLKDALSATGGNCPSCGTQIPGFWKARPRDRLSGGEVRPFL